MTEPVAELDPPVRGLVWVLNRFPGITTYTSCGGHPAAEREGRDDRAEEGCWYVDFHVDRTDEGWISLEFFAWVAYDLCPGGVQFEALAKAPYLNEPGKMLWFRWCGWDPGDEASAADAFAELLAAARARYYVTAEQAQALNTGADLSPELLEEVRRIADAVAAGRRVTEAELDTLRELETALGQVSIEQWLAQQGGPP